MLEYSVLVMIFSFLLSVIFTGLLGVSINESDIQNLREGKTPVGYLPFLFANLCLWFRIIFTVSAVFTLALIVKKGIDFIM